jgi:hypothetical protein
VTTEGPPEPSVPTEPTEEDFARAEEKFASYPWLKLPMVSLDQGQAERCLRDAAFRAYARLLALQYRSGSVPADPATAARIIGLSTAATREALGLFSELTEDGTGRMHSGLADLRHEALLAQAVTIMKGRRAGLASGRARRQSKPPEPNKLVEQPSSTDVDVDVHVVVLPPEGVAARAEATKAAALEAARAGMVVTPLVFGEKVPPQGRAVRWLRSEEEVAASWPAEANLGIQPGQSGVIEVDIDSAEGEAIAVELGCFAEPTFTVRTPRAALPADHPKAFTNAARLRFLLPDGLRFGKVKLRGVLEVFGQSGYIVAPPSWFTGYGAGYEVVRAVSPLPAPSRLVAAIEQAAGGTSFGAAPRGGGGRAWAFAAALHRVTGQLVAPNHPKQHTVECPAHADATASLSVQVKPRGEILFHCHAGCQPEEVLASLGLTWREFYGENVA